MFEVSKIHNIIKIFLLVLILLLINLNSALASTLNLGEETYRFRGFWVDSNEGDLITFDAGYGLDQYSGLGLRILAPTNMERGIIELEYQFIPEDFQGEEEYNYAFKIGAANATVVDDEFAVKTGFIIENNFDDYDLYFNTNLYLQGLTMNLEDLLANIELGISRELMPGVDLLFGYSALTTPSEEVDIIHGAKYGVELKF